MLEKGMCSIAREPAVHRRFRWVAVHLFLALGMGDLIIPQYCWDGQNELGLFDRVSPEAWRLAWAAQSVAFCIPGFWCATAHTVQKSTVFCYTTPAQKHRRAQAPALCCPAHVISGGLCMPCITCAAEHALPHASHPPAAFDLPGAQCLQILPSDQQSLRPLWLGRPRFWKWSVL